MIDLDGIVAEFHYWSYGEAAETAMTSRREVVEEDLKEIAEKYDVTTSFERVSAHFWAGMFRVRMPSYRKTVVRVVGDDGEKVRMCLREIFEEYGKPDEVPLAFSGNKGRGRRIIESVLREL